MLQLQNEMDENILTLQHDIIKKLNDEEQTKLQSMASVWIELKKNVINLLLLIMHLFELQSIIK
jgi:hypothetical protein